MGVNKQEHRKKIIRSIKSLCGGLSPTTALLIDRTEHGSRQKAKLEIEKDFDSQWNGSHFNNTKSIKD